MGSLGAHNVFVYGSLLADEVVSTLLRRLPTTYPAFLSDFHRFSIKGRNYPAILPAKGDKVLGRVLFGLSDNELSILDDFEDEEYLRKSVEVQRLEDGSKLQSFAYVWADVDDEELYGDWDYEEWRRVHFESFLAMSSEFADDRIAVRPKE
ncbi:hypothetical protein KP509_34G064300 [Ceratopteris richardii]|uniref:Putative gamma-glutamylcyclotransferase n=1 Tax=Ceratopteris richardii TaxID=49495 RepID=A0A8T2QL43_CERRI|nr:hypothetical protein KP509_34G064300 [Ceratopteris richardii]